jgi:hypothetical protein
LKNKTSVSDNLTLAPSGDIILAPAGSDILPLNNYTYNLGAISSKYLALYAAELWVENLVAQDVMATIGGHILVAPTTTLTQNLSSGSTTIHVKHNNLALGDIIYLNTSGQIEFMSLSTNLTAESGGYYGTVVRNLDGSGANDWLAGDAIVNTGVTGDGFIDIYSASGILSGSGSAIVGNVRIGSSYSSIVESWAIGNLNGLYGYATDTFGVGLGMYYDAHSFVTLDATYGIRFHYLSGVVDTTIAQWANDGTITIGRIGANQDNIYISAGAISIRNNTTERIGLSSAGILTIKDSSGNAVLTFDASAGAEITKKFTMPGASSAIAIGTTPPTSAGAGTGIWIDRTGFYALASDVVQVKIDGTNGQMTAGAGHLIIDANGIALKTLTSYNTLAGYNFLSPAGDYMAGFEAYTDPGDSFFCRITVPAANERYNEIWLDARGDVDHCGTIVLYTNSNSNSASLRVTTWDGYGGPYISLTYAPVVIGNTAYSQIGAFGEGDILISGDLVKVPVYDGYVGYIFHPLPTHATSANWLGSLHSTTSKTVIDLSVQFGLPPNIKAVSIRLAASDSSSSGAGLYFAVSPNGTAGTDHYVVVRPSGLPNNYVSENSGVVTCDANGDIWFQCVASGTNTLSVYLLITGYWI